MLIQLYKIYYFYMLILSRLFFIKILEFGFLNFLIKSKTLTSASPRQFYSRILYVSREEL